MSIIKPPVQKYLSLSVLVRVLRAGAGIFFTAYIALFPGATATVALDRVPAWGVAFGGLLLILQGVAMLCWLGGRAGLRGLFVGIGIGALAFAVEYTGVRTGFPFGRYGYTDVLQPQVLGVVPLAICAAWVMVVPSAVELARVLTPSRWNMHARLLLAATLILLLDLQIETVATQINRYWRWVDTGVYYGVPLANFVAWWLVGLALAWLVAWGTQSGKKQATGSDVASRRWWDVVLCSSFIPCALYLLSTVMFTVTNLARGYVVAGGFGIGTLVALSICWWMMNSPHAKVSNQGSKIG